MKGHRAQPAKGRCKAAARRKQGQASESRSVGSLRTHSFLWQRSNTCVAFPTGSSSGTQCPRFWLEAGHVNPLCLACFKLQTPRRTAGVQHKPLLDRQFRPSEPILSISRGTVRTVLRSKLPRNLASPGPDLQAGPHRMVGPTLGAPFYT